jgi:hypothetical protein
VALSEAEADELLDGWDLEAVQGALSRQDHRYWSDGEAWMRERTDIRTD